MQSNSLGETNMTLTVWSHEDESVTCVPGVLPPRSAAGLPLHYINILLLTFEADSIEEGFELYDNWLKSQLT